MNLRCIVIFQIKPFKEMPSHIKLIFMDYFPIIKWDFCMIIAVYCHVIVSGKITEYKLN